MAASESVNTLSCSQDLVVHQLSFGMMSNFQYLIQSGRQAVAVDAAWDIEGLKSFAEKRGLTLVGGLYTHRHADHVGGRHTGMESLPALPGAADLRPLPLWIGAGDLEGAAEACQLPPSAWTALAEGDTVRPLGDGSALEVVVVDTPGHTEGGVSLLVREVDPDKGADGKCADGVLFTGDTLFAEAAGRTDLPGGSEDQLLRSLSRLSKLPGRTIVFPGHSYGPRPRTTLRKELKANSFMKRARQRFPPSSVPDLPAAALPRADSAAAAGARTEEL